jgi:8-oxo-dGTP diphosphatase
MSNKQHKNPIPTVDTIIQKDSQILFVERKKDPFKGFLVFPGGFVNEGEKIEDAALREVKEETSLLVELVDILGVYSDPARDPRGHMMSTVFIGKISPNNKDEAKAGDDAEALKWVDLDNIDRQNIGFDHKKIISDYNKWRQSNRGTYWSSR